jgi:thiol:disulfide interchange protein
MTNNDQRIAKDLDRVDRVQIPVNLIYPSNYPEEPAILLEGLFGPSEALEALSKAEEFSERQTALPIP